MSLDLQGDSTCFVPKTQFTGIPVSRARHLLATALRAAILQTVTLYANGQRKFNMQGAHRMYAGSHLGSSLPTGVACSRGLSTKHHLASQLSLAKPSLDDTLTWQVSDDGMNNEKGCRTLLGRKFAVTQQLASAVTGRPALPAADRGAKEYRNAHQIGIRLVA